MFKLRWRLSFCTFRVSSFVASRPAIIAQEAFQRWLEELSAKTCEFFHTVHNDKTLNNQLKTCQTPAEAIALAGQCGIPLSENDLKQAVIAAESIKGFSFEKLWFRGLGLLR